MGSLKIVATPIGNIRDISLRALDELKAADVILAEDTRHTGNLLSALGIKLKKSSRLISCNAHQEQKRSELVLSLLKQKLNVVLVSDAGTPSISDPGSLLTQALITAGARIEVIPGPSALGAALMGAGLDNTRFAFLGFLPRKKIARKKIVEAADKAQLSLVFYESPLRVQALLDELYDLLGTRRVVVARELTKIFETFHRGVLGSPLNPAFIAKGECVVIVESASDGDQRAHSEQEIIDFIISSNSDKKDIITMLTKIYNIKKKDAYNLVLKIKT
jgi:16S rRNA (cytidine1402-2'-O)-methyltransferase